MENNTFEGLEELEQINVDFKAPSDLKEYEKLLIAERNRVQFEQASNLVRLGCFNQKEETELDFTQLTKISADKKLKGKYDLYQNIKTLETVFVCPLVEEDKEEGSHKAYAYDCLYVEKMDQETYEQVVKAGDNNLVTLPGVLYKASLICYGILLAITLFVIIYNFIAYGDSSNDYSFGYILNAVFGNSAIYLAADVVILPLLVLATIKRRDSKK